MTLRSLRSTGISGPTILGTMSPEELGKMVRDIVRQEIATAFDTNLQPNSEKLEKLDDSIQTICTKVKDLETSANDMETCLNTAQKNYTDILKNYKELTEKTDPALLHRTVRTIAC